MTVLQCSCWLVFTGLIDDPQKNTQRVLQHCFQECPLYQAFGHDDELFCICAVFSTDKYNDDKRQ